MTKEEQMRGMLVTLANHPHCNYAHPANGEGPYGIGVTDGHRCVALTVQKFLKALDAPPADPETVTPAKGYRLVPNDPRTPIYDAYGRWVADCRDKETAELIVSLLNTQAAPSLRPAEVETVIAKIEFLHHAAKNIEDSGNDDDIRTLWRGKAIAYETVLALLISLTDTPAEKGT